MAPTDPLIEAIVSSIYGDYFESPLFPCIPLDSPTAPGANAAGEFAQFEQKPAVITGRMDAILLERALSAVAQHRADDTRVFVYVISCEEAGASKIGISALPQERLRALQTASFGQLKLDAIFRGGRSLEKALHLILSGCCEKRGEWLRKNATMQEFIKLANAYDIRNERRRDRKRERGPLYEWAMRHYHLNGRPREVIET